jgi:betaine-aldehyde dehydrogenase
VGEIASQSIKRVTLELGGKSANVVSADADLEKAAASAPLAVFGNAGQDCCARSRISSSAPQSSPFLEALEREVKALRVGDPLDDATQMGPLISADHREKVASYVDDDAPGRLPRLGAGRVRLLVPPTVLSPVSNDDRAAREEIFGPVAAVIPSTTRPRRSRSPTTRSTGSRARSGRGTVRALSASHARSRPATSRSTRTVQCV